ncbi:MAG: aminotransferase class V-fold PLP-dependent enzyme [Candidatus Kaiserbacteria bacterium]|nr:aminotransferase class V-fold PLP-dependent enzyme [Candidatus Kaiserbacteria bacterium]
MKHRYFDSGAFTPLHKKSYRAVRDVLRKQVQGSLGNPLSAHHHGRAADDYVERSRTMIARTYQMQAGDIIFTSGATEANLLAVRTALLQGLRDGKPLTDMHVLIGFDEHSSVFKVLEYVRTLGVRGTIATPSRGRLFTPEDIVKEVRENTVCLSLQLVNSLHGLVQPIARIADACREKQPAIFVHTDSAQGTAYHNCSPHTLRVDAATIDGTKTFGPQGVGALLFQEAKRYTGLQGEHSVFDMRPGTPPVALIYGFSTAVQETHRHQSDLIQHISSLRQSLAEQIDASFSDVYVLGLEKYLKDVRPADWKKLAPHLLYVTFPNTNHAYLATLLDTHGFSTSTSSACSVQGVEAIRMGLLPSTTKKEVRKLVQAMKTCLPLATT